MSVGREAGRGSRAHRLVTHRCYCSCSLALHSRGCCQRCTLYLSQGEGEAAVLGTRQHDNRPDLTLTLSSATTKAALFSKKEPSAVIQTTKGTPNYYDDVYTLAFLSRLEYLCLIYRVM